MIIFLCLDRQMVKVEVIKHKNMTTDKNNKNNKNNVRYTQDTFQRHNKA